MSDRILAALGAQDEIEALRVIAESAQFLADVKVATGRETFAASLEVMRTAIAFARELVAVTEKPEQESLGVVMAWKSSHERLPVLETEKAELDEKVRTQEIKSLIAAGLETPRPGANEHAGKLVPATAKFWESKTPVELQAFLAVAPRVIPGEVKQVPAGSTVFSPNTSGRIANADGKAYEDLYPSERMALRKADEALFNAMRDDWNRVGKPAGVVNAN